MSIVLPGRSFNTPIAVTPADGVENLRMDSVSAAYLANEGTVAATVKIRFFTSPAAHTFSINPGDAFQLPAGARGVEATGSSNAGSLKAFF